MDPRLFVSFFFNIENDHSPLELDTAIQQQIRIEISISWNAINSGESVRHFKSLMKVDFSSIKK